MKKLTAILLTAVLLVSMCVVVPTVASAADYSTKAFWITHYNTYTEAAGCVFTETDTGGSYGVHVAFAPIADSNAFEIVEISDGSSTGTATALTVPAGGFVYVIERGNDYDDLYNADPVTYGWCAGQPNYCNPSANAAIDMILAEWAVGDKFAFGGLDLEGFTVPTTTPEKLWYDDSADGYVGTATVTPYVRYDETETTLENGDHAFGVANGFTFDIANVNGGIVSGGCIVQDNLDSWAACGAGWAISVHLTPNEDGTYNPEKVVVTPVLSYDADSSWSMDAAEAATAAATEFAGFEEGDLILVVHSDGSTPEFPNYQAKIAAIALKDGDRVIFDDDMTFAYVLMPGDVVETEDEGGNEGGNEGEEPELSLKDLFEAINADRMNGGVLDIILDAPETYKAGDEITVTATVKNITAEGGLHLVQFALQYDATQLELISDLLEGEENAVDCVTKAPEGFENLTHVNFEMDGETAVAVNDGVIEVVLLTDGELGAVNDGDIVLTFKFKAKEDASKETGAIVPNESVYAATNIPISEQYPNGDIVEHVGNGSYVVLAYDETTPDPVPTPGDNTNAIVFVVLALVTVMGTAIVVKNRK